MEAFISEKERQDQQVARTTSAIIHALLLALLFLPLLKFPIPPPGQEGILVSFGVPDQGEGDDKPMTQNEEIVDPTPPSTPPPPPEPEVEPEVEEVAKPKETAPPKAPDKKVITAEDPDVAALKKKQKEEAVKAAEDAKVRKAEEARVKKEEDAKKQAAVEEARKVAAAEDARKRAEAAAAAEAARQKAEYDNAKKQYGDVFGAGKGNTGKPGNQGDPNGDPNADNLKGISTGSGKIGGGLDGRGVLFTPSVEEKSQRTGRVVVNVCVDKNGKVTSAKYTQKGSTTADANLKQISEESSRKFKFSASDIPEQCGTITFDFKVK